MESFQGYDIDNQMAKLSRVNMYLHNFKKPRIYEYDTLTREERWKDSFSVILANPPFMSPKGGIMPNPKFGIKSSRSEVLFVQYFIDHLKQNNGRAGMIVPEGIIFQSGSAHRQIRENLIRDGLYAVVSLPAGVFNPYSGVKTSILLFDNTIVKKTKKLLFVRISNDGFSLGAQRHPVDKNDLPDALNVLQAWRRHILEGSTMLDSSIATAVEREDINKTDDLSLSIERYSPEEKLSHSSWPMVSLGEISEILDNKRKPVKEADRKKGPYPYYGATGIVDFVDQYLFDEKLVLVGEDGAKWGSGEKTAFIVDGKYWVNNHAHVLRPDRKKILDEFLVTMINSIDLSSYITGVTVPKLNQKKLRSIKIPLPQLAYQKELVSEIGSYQQIIDGASQIISNWKPRINTDSSWLVKQIGDLVDTITPPKKFQKTEYTEEGEYPIIDQSQNEIAGWTSEKSALIKISKPVVIFGDHTCVVKFSEKPFAQGADGIKVIETHEELLPKYLYYSLLADPLMPTGYKRHFGDLQRKMIAVPPIEKQLEIVEQIDIEAGFIESNKNLISLYESRIKDAIANFWNK